MVKANITLPNGTEITIDETPDEVQALLGQYGRPDSGVATPKSKNKKSAKKKSAAKSGSSSEVEHSSTVDIPEIVNLVKNCDEAEEIETQILDRASQVDRVLLALYIVHEYLDNSYKLSSGDIASVTRDLGNPVSSQNASRTLTGSASKYVMADGVRKKGSKLGYKLSRRGVTYMKGVIGGKSDEK